ncbi:GTA-gp10 family protein [Salipiger thiooxidans]|uniref:GTA-gp10 family protein n=1 Tax=Salipiger thiooxidans TaxID=282683 RepID=UPI001CFAB9F6|nr:GTA-gp10 family protein [Salipiger thiooxidans]
MAVSSQPPRGGIAAELGGKSRPLILRNAEIERFEAQHDLGIFAMLDRLLGRSEPPQARHIRDLVALGLIGGGLPDRAADDMVSSMPPSENHRLREIASDLIVFAFMPEAPEKKSAEAGSSKPKRVKTTSGTSKEGSSKSSQPA